MSDVLKPRDAREIADAVQWALANGKALEIAGNGSKRALGRPVQTDVTLELSGLAGVTLYEPEELVLTAKAGTPLAEIEALIAAKGQMLAFEPIDFGPLLGAPAGAATIGGVLATNMAGPRRVKAGAARDHFLGFSAVSGRGEIFKSGGRVVKNVTGYDLCKLMAGSWGTLAVLAETTVKVLPKPETEETLAVLGLDERSAVAAMGRAMGAPCEVSAAAHVPAAVAPRILAGAKDAVTALRLEGVAASLAHRRLVLEAALKPVPGLAVLGERDSRAFWNDVRDLTPFAGQAAERHLWRISTAPAKGAELGLAIADRADAELVYDWAGGLLWAALAPADDAGARVVRAALARNGGHATLIRAPAAIRAAVDVFQPEDRALMALSHRVKHGFDPKGVLNPGRMWAGV
jgi:glycolate oxidase FAD binding subunit